MDLRTGIIDTARALGMNPLDLATIISYETAGTFDPTKRGPTTQWGQHRGLIQFGEPQAQQFGVDWNDPVRSQLGADGAIAKYYRASGWKPGMGLLDAYSVVNAGAPGRYNASDANNGGAPGTVRDKVEQQMTGHREKAAALLGGDFTASGGQAVMTGGAGDDTMQTERRGFLGRMFGDMDPERRDKLIVALEGMTHNPNQALMDQAQSRIDERRIDARTAAQVNKTVEYLRANGSGDLADAVASGVFDPGQAVTQHYSRAEAGQAKATEAARREQAAAYADQYGRADVAAAIRSGVIGPEEGGKMILTGEKVTPTDDMREYDFAKSQGYSGTFQQYQTEMKRAGAGSTIIGGQQDPQWGNAPNDHVWLRNEAGQVITEADPSGRGVRPVAVPVSGSKAATEAAEAERTAGNSAGMRDTATDTIVTAAQRAREAASKRAFGGYGHGVAEYIPWTDSAEVSRQTEVLKSTAKVENLTAMRMASPTGGALGSVTENESKMLAAKSGALDPSSPNFLRDLDDYERTLLQVIHGYEAGNAIYEQTRREKAGATTKRPPSGLADDDLKYLGGN